MSVKDSASNLNCSLSYNSSENSVGYWDTNNGWVPWVYPDYHYYYPSVTYQVHTEDRVSKAFKIITKLMELGVVKEMTIQDFIKTVTEISIII